MSYSPDGKRLCVHTLYETNEWEISTGQCICTYPVRGKLGFLVHSPDGTRICLGGEDSLETEEYSTQTGERIHSYGECDCVCYDTEGKHLFTGTYGGVEEWNLADGSRVRACPTDGKQITALCYAPDHIHLYAGTSEGELIEINHRRNTGTCFQKGRSFFSMCISQSTERPFLWAATGNIISEWNCRTGLCEKAFELIPEEIGSISGSADGKKVCAGTREGSVCEWDTSTGKCIKKLSASIKDIYFVRYSADGSRICAVASGKIADFDLATGESYVYEFPDNWLNDACYSTDGTKLCVATFFREIIWWDLSTGEQLWAAERAGTSSVSLRFSTDDKTIFVETTHGERMELNAETGECLRRYDILEDLNETIDSYFDEDFDGERDAYRVDFSPSGKRACIRIPIMGGGCQLIELDMETKRRMPTDFISEFGLSSSLNYSADEKEMILTDGKTAEIFNMETHEKEEKLYYTFCPGINGCEFRRLPFVDQFNPFEKWRLRSYGVVFDSWNK